MKRWLLDTNVLSELVRREPDTSVARRIASHGKDELCTSAVCAMELRAGACNHPTGPAFWERIVTEILATTICLPVNWRVALTAGDVIGALRRQGTCMDLADALIAATCIEHRCIMVSRNVRHFAVVPGLKVENWFDEAAC